ncbi:hypothetical protein GOP47_0021459 [Adiantum capillus-veneris]|uniref:Uncharacterized protein n=1 Tax=Adiantum capillus-veneris TaxID=13818 RepID=A0A9D4U7T8_ADICA|nr:hypothetical protein GOP47_0021459 [Adiantum capillus-veneris]
MASVSPSMQLAQSSTNRVTKSASSTQIQTYMRKKNRLRSKEKRAALTQAQAEMAARKERLKVLEMERRARLCIDALNEKERGETFPRPQWDSNVSASTGEINGPWLRSSHPVTPVDFPLPKAIDGDGLSSAGLASKSSCKSFCTSIERSGTVQETSNITDCNSLEASHSVKSRSYSQVQSFKDGAKEMRSLQSRIAKNFQNRELFGQPFSKTFPKYVPNFTSFQQAYDTESSAPLSYCDDEIGHSIFSSNKQNLSTYTLTSQDIKSVERKLKMHAQANGLDDKVHMPATIHNGYNAMDKINESMPYHSQYLTYHLERFPSQYKREALTEKKRVALLKVLAQQLVIRLNTAESHPSYLLDGQVRAHALSLRKNLEKFQEELHAAVKALEAFYSQPSRMKSSGYIVLPSKLERKRNFKSDKSLAGRSQTAAVYSLQREEAFNGQYVLLDHDLSSEKAKSATSTEMDSPILQEGIKNGQQSLRIGDSLKDIVLSSCGESNEGFLEAKASDDMFQELEYRLRSICVDSKFESSIKEKRTWDHHLLDRELEKLDAEIKETKLRMALNLFSSHPLADSERSMDLPNLAEEKSTYIYHAQIEPIGASGCEKRLRQFDSSSLEENSLDVNEKNVKDDDGISTDEKGNTVSIYDYYVGPGEPVANDAPRSVAGRDMTASGKSFETSTIDANMEICTAHHQVRRVEIFQMAPEEPRSDGDLKVLFKQQGMNADQEILADTITEALMQELLYSELSDMVLHSQDRLRASGLRRMKREMLECVKQKSADLRGACRVQYLSDVLPRSPCTSVSTSPLPAEESPIICSAGPLMTYDDFDPWKYQNYDDDDPATTMESISPANDIVELYREPFKVTSKRLVAKFVEEILEAQGLSTVSSLLEVYASGETLSLRFLEKRSIGDERNVEEKLYGKMLLEAVCECLDKKFLRFYLPTFFLFLQPCPAEPYLKEALVNNVNEHADAACEGGFSLEYILEKSLDEEDWKAAHQEMVEVIHEVSEHVMVDTIYNIACELMAMKQTRCSLQASPGFLPPMWGANCLQLID